MASAAKAFIASIICPCLVPLSQDGGEEYFSMWQRSYMLMVECLTESLKDGMDEI